MNIHALLSSMSPWGTLDDKELIVNEDEDGDAWPIWYGFNGREEWTPVDTVNALMERLSKLFEMMKDTEMSEEDRDELAKGMGGPSELFPKFMHALSMAIDDSVEAEIGLSKEHQEEGDLAVNFHAYKKVSFNGAGLGEVIKAALIAKAAQGGF